MRRLLTALVFTLPFLLTACVSYSVHLYSDPNLLQVIDESLVLTEADVDEANPYAVLIRGDSVVVIGERRNNWEYEQDFHDRYFIVYYDGRRSYVPYRSLVSRNQYASMYGPGRNPDTNPTNPGGVGTGGEVAQDTARAVPPSAGDLTGGPRAGERTVRP